MKEKAKYHKKQELYATILLDYIRGLSSSEARAEVELWLRTDEANEEILLDTSSIFYALQTEKRIAARDPLQAFERVMQRRKNRERKLWLNRVLATAACIAGVMFFSTMLNFWKHENIKPQPQIITVESNAGMRSHFNLPDGTEVYLNSGSSISYPLPYDGDKRRVELNGEAYFKVVHNPKKPFIVAVCDNIQELEVLGTEFNLQAYENESIIKTTLVKGSVSLLLKNSKGERYEQILRASEKAVYDITTGEVSVSIVDTEYETAWKEGKLMFKNDPMPEILKKLSSFYDVEFEIRDKIVETYRFTGTFEKRQLFQILNYLKLSSNIDFRNNQESEDGKLGVKYTVVTSQK